MLDKVVAGIRNGLYCIDEETRFYNSEDSLAFPEDVREFYHHNIFTKINVIIGFVIDEFR